jgi:hypothetical protein
LFEHNSGARQLGKEVVVSCSPEGSPESWQYYGR